MKVEILPDEEAVAERAAGVIAETVRRVAASGRSCRLALSGGHTPWKMTARLVEHELPWGQVEIFQVDERVAPAGDPNRNLTHLQETLLGHVPLSAEQVHAMPVEAKTLEQGAQEYSEVLSKLAGAPPVLDLVHLGLGPDGHTASLVPGDPALEVQDGWVSVAGPYQDHLRMTLTYPVLNAAERVLWVVTGEAKAKMLRKLHEGDETIPAGRVRPKDALVLADRAAAARL